ncbi:MAG: hypothetical protein ACD_75C01236G0001, partial [uncultured bacterium]
EMPPATIIFLFIFIYHPRSKKLKAYLPLATLLLDRHKNKIRLQSLAHKAVRGGNNKTLENLHSPIEYLILEVSGGKKSIPAPDSRNQASEHHLIPDIEEG